MTSRERLLKVLHREIPDHVPAAPDLWEMIPIRLLKGRPSWEMLLYRDPPVWKARADAARHFGVDGFFGLFIPHETDPQEVIVFQDDSRIVTRFRTETESGIQWSPTANLYTPNEATAAGVALNVVGQTEVPERWTEIKRNYNKTGREYFEDARAYVGESGLTGPCVWLPSLSSNQDEIYRYYDDPDAVREEKQCEGERILRLTEEYLSWNPDMLFIGNSGMMLFNPEPVFRDLSLEWLKKITAMAKAKGVPTHIHCCGPEKTLARIGAEETDLTSLEPLEIPPMGDCVLKEIKALYGDRLVLKGNLHTTETMWRGTPEKVEEACKRAIDEAAEGGGFILSTGDQTPRDTPDENLRIMQRVAETYGRY
jgi:uroporphyrinogen decarboxylase